MKFNIEGKTALITGADSGIGKSKVKKYRTSIRDNVIQVHSDAFGVVYKI